MTQGHESGHPSATPPLALDWAQLVDHLADEMGGLSELARDLQDAAPPGARLSDDPLTVERGLRRLRNRRHAEGNKYGRLLLRCYGLPRSVSAWAKEMGQYHSRTSDLPVALRADQLRLWSRPPIAESLDAVWVHLALAMVAHRRGDMQRVHREAELAQLTSSAQRPAAQLELLLLRARLAAEPRAARVHLDACEAALSSVAAEDAACYRARLWDQRAYLLNRTEGLEAGLAAYERIPEEGPAFVRFRRAHGRAYCLWRLGRAEEALDAARAAGRHAGDGGFIRFRLMSVLLEAHIDVSGRGELLARAARMASVVEDAGFLAKVESLAARWLPAL